MIFDSIEKLPLDPILGLSVSFAEDDRPNKVNLGVGVYRDGSGLTPIFPAVKAAEQELLQSQSSKAYVAQAGDPVFLEQMTSLVLGADLISSIKDRSAAVTTLGGSGALRMAAEVVVGNRPETSFWVSTPTWGNHRPLLSASGAEVKQYPYYDVTNSAVDFTQMMETLATVPAGDVVVLHACCHNPTGADLTNKQWDEVVELAAQVGFIPLLDMAYQGFGSSLDEDVYGVRRAVSQLDEVLVACSNSKNFGVYRERAGVLIVVGASASDTAAVKSQVLSAARRSYSMPAYHGPAVVGRVLASEKLNAQWKAELAEARGRINSLRTQFAEDLNEAQSVRDFSFIGSQSGMFSLLGLSPEQVVRLRDEYALYMVGSSRVNIAGLTVETIPVAVEAISTVLSNS